MISQGAFRCPCCNAVLVSTIMHLGKIYSAEVRIPAEGEVEETGIETSAKPCTDKEPI